MRADPFEQREVEGLRINIRASQHGERVEIASGI
jgi:hypothetical protein